MSSPDLTEAPGCILVVGAGEAGVAAAVALRGAGYAGRIVLLDAEGHPPYERPPLSKEALLEPAAPTRSIQPCDAYAAHAIELRLGWRVVAVDAVARRVTAEGPGGAERLAYDQLLFATGGRARRLPMLDAAGALALRTRDDADEIRRRLATARRVLVVGGGVIGLELAASARARGADVTVIEAAPRLMSRCLAPEASAWLAERHRQAGVDLRLAACVEHVERAGSGAAALLSDGSEIAADLLLAGIGMAPDAEIAATAGCRVEDGILVDGAGRTSVEGLFAAGDVARFTHPLFDVSLRPESWQHAQRHGAHVGRAMLGGHDAYREVPWFWTDQHGANVQVAGLPHLADTTVRRGPRTWFHLKAGRLVGATTIDNGRDMRPAIRLIETAVAVDAAMLADEDVPLRRIVERASDAPAAAVA